MLHRSRCQEYLLCHPSLPSPLSHETSLSSPLSFSPLCHFIRLSPHLSLSLFLLSFRFNPSSLWRYFSYLRILVTDFVSLCLDRVIDIRVSVFVTPDSWAFMINLACFACQLHRMFCRGRCRFNEPRSKSFYNFIIFVRVTKSLSWKIACKVKLYYENLYVFKYQNRLYQFSRCLASENVRFSDAKLHRRFPKTTIIACISLRYLIKWRIHDDEGCSTGIVQFSKDWPRMT